MPHRTDSLVGRHATELAAASSPARDCTRSSHDEQDSLVAPDAGSASGPLRRFAVDGWRVSPGARTTQERIAIPQELRWPGASGPVAGAATTSTTPSPRSMSPKRRRECRTGRPRPGRRARGHPRTRRGKHPTRPDRRTTGSLTRNEHRSHAASAEAENVPLRRSISVPSELYPTAKQLRVLVHDTPLRVRAARAGVGAWEDGQLVRSNLDQRAAPDGEAGSGAGAR